MDKRALIGIALSVLVLIVYQQFINHNYGPVPTESPAPAEVKGTPEKTPTAETPPPTAAGAPPHAVPAKSTARDLTIETDNYLAVFTTQGARLKSFKFKKYRTSADEKSPPFEIVSNAAGVP